MTSMQEGLKTHMCCQAEGIGKGTVTDEGGCAGGRESHNGNSETSSVIVILKRCGGYL